MNAFNFKTDHLRSIHASPEERVAINQELNALYASLPEAEKQDFNAQPQPVGVREMERLKTDYESIRGNAPKAQ